MGAIKILHIKHFTKKSKTAIKKATNEPPFYPFLYSFLLNSIAKPGTHAGNQLICYCLFAGIH